MNTLRNSEDAIQLLRKDIFKEYETICENRSEIKFDKLLEGVCETKFISICMKKLKDYDYSTYIHSLRVGIYSMIIGCLLGYDEKFVIEIGVAGLLHDIGKKFIPNEIINKKGKLDALESCIVQAHVSMSTYYIQKKYEFENQNIISGVYQHHERLDGSGYPRHLREDEISIPGRILSIADVFEAYSSNRAYHESRTVGQTIKFMNSLDGFDKDILKVFTSYLK